MGTKHCRACGGTRASHTLPWWALLGHARASLGVLPQTSPRPLFSERSPLLILPLLVAPPPHPSSSAGRGSSLISPAPPLASAMACPPPGAEVDALFLPPLPAAATVCPPLSGQQLPFPAIGLPEERADAFVPDETQPSPARSQTADSGIVEEAGSWCVSSIDRSLQHPAPLGVCVAARCDSLFGRVMDGVGGDETYPPGPG